MKKNYMFIVIVAALFLAGPALAGSPLENLGGAIYKDLNLSIGQNQSCMTCHHPSAGFADSENRVLGTPVSDGSIPTFVGGRNAPTAAYAGFSPIFHWNSTEELFFGGLFWDGRATGMTIDIFGPTATGDLGDGPTGDPLADQAKGPFLNGVEMALASEDVVMAIIQASDYADLFEKVFGPNAFADTDVAYNNASLAIAAFERSEKLNKFSSKFDAFVKEQGGDISNFGVEIIGSGENAFRKYVGPGDGFKSKVYSYDEADGLAIFNSDSYTQLGLAPDGPNGAMCYLCHLTENHVVAADDPNRPANGPMPGTYNPILTDFSYDNLGIPANPLLSGNPVDLGLGGQPAQLWAAHPSGNDYVPAQENGKFKVSSLRNISRTAPYGHNGFFATLYEIVNFYNTRDVGLWPPAEVPETVNGDELGNLGLTLEQEQKLVMFLETLND